MSRRVPRSVQYRELSVVAVVPVAVARSRTKLPKAAQPSLWPADGVPTLMTEQQVAAALGMTPTTVRKAVQTGRLKPAMVLFRPADLGIRLESRAPAQPLASFRVC
jgi:hypothetical protein